MNNLNFDEESYETSIIELFTKDLGYESIYGNDADVRDFNKPVYLPVLENSLIKLNSNLPPVAIEEAINKIVNFDNAFLIEQNKEFMKYLQTGMQISYFDNGEKKDDIVKLIDYQNVDNNSFIIANQWTFIEKSKKRPDLVVLINGLPLVVCELKSPSREETNASEGYLQLRNYLQEIPSLFIYNCFLVISDMTFSKAGTITSNEDRYSEWKSKDGSYQVGRIIGFTTFFEGMFQKDRLLDIIQNFSLFSEQGTNTYKILAGYHQYFAVNKAIESTVKAISGDKKGGVFWHTQGSGKSLSMIFYAHKIQSVLNSPTIVVVTDRNDLDNQLFKTFLNSSNFLGQVPIQARDGDHLKELLNGRLSNGIFFTTIQKFELIREVLSERENIILMADEAHRSHYGLMETTKAFKLENGTKVTKIRTGAARSMRNALPNATYIGFTGTPLTKDSKNTIQVFGDYIDIYDMTQAVADGATRPVYYENRVIQLKLDEKILKKIDDFYDVMAGQVDQETIEKSKKELGNLEAILGHEKTINSLVNDILLHYENNREFLFTGKAMIIAYNRSIAMKIYKRILELRPQWTEKVAVVMTESNKDPEEWRPIIGNKTKRDKLAIKFKDDESPLKIAIVVDMWLTGFDLPSLSTLYVFKPMKEHNLMQAIARVNRIYKDKAGGLVVDYIGIAAALKDAMSSYTKRDNDNYGNMDIAAEAYPLFQEKLEICQDIFYSFDYSGFFTDSDLKRAVTIEKGGDFLLNPALEDDKKIFLNEAYALEKALSLCSSIVPENERMHAAFFRAVRILLIRIAAAGFGGKKGVKEINKEINELLKQSLKSEGVINVFSDYDYSFSLFDPSFLKEILDMQQKNLALEMLKKLLEDKIKTFKRTNLVKSIKFSERFQHLLNSYINGLITNQEVINELIKMAEEIKNSADSGKEMGLSEEEMAFYDALSEPQAVKDAYTNEQLVNLTKELTDMLRKNKTIDWQQRENQRAKMRVLVKKLLRKYKYPPGRQQEAIDIVISQCELWADNTDY